MPNLYDKLSEYPIRKSYLFFVFLTSFFIGLVLFLTEIYFSYRQINRDIETNLKQKTIEYQGILNDTIREKNGNQIRRIIASISAETNFEAAWLSDENHYIFAAGKSRYIGLLQNVILSKYGLSLDPTVHKKNKNCYYRSGYFVFVCIPLSLGVSKGYIAPNRYGEFWLIYQIHEAVNEQIRKKLCLSLFYSALTVTLSLTFFYFLYASIIVRIISLRNNAVKFGKGAGDFDFRVNGKDEIAQLAQTLQETAVMLKTKEEKILVQESQMRQYVDIIDEYIITSKTDPSGIIIYASKAFCKISGYSKTEVIGKNHNIVRHPDMPKKIYQDLWKTIKKGKIWQGELKNKKKNGDYYWVDVKITPSFDSSGKIIEYTAIRQDITAQKRIEEISIKDELTQLYNRRYFNRIFQEQLQRAKRYQSSLFFAILDIDYFKLYNDTYGHLGGDKVLKDTAGSLLKSFQRPDDYIFRLGGEEFGLLVNVDKQKNAELVCQKIKAAFESLKIEHKTSKAAPIVTASSGAVFIKKIKANITSDSLYQTADTALYQSKKKGRNCYTLNII